MSIKLLTMLVVIVGLVKQKIVKECWTSTKLVMSAELSYQLWISMLVMTAGLA